MVSAKIESRIRIMSRKLLAIAFALSVAALSAKAGPAMCVIRVFSSEKVSPLSANHFLSFS